MDPNEPITTSEDGTDDDGNPVRSVNVEAPAARIGAVPGEVT